MCSSVEHLWPLRSSFIFHFLTSISFCRSLSILRESKRKSSTKILGAGGGGGRDERAGKLGPEKYLGTFAIYLTALVLSAAVAASEVVERRTKRWKGRNISRSAAVIVIKVQSVSSNYETYF